MSPAWLRSVSAWFLMALTVPALCGCVQAPPAKPDSTLPVFDVRSPSLVDYPLADMVEHQRRAVELENQARGLGERLEELRERERALLDELAALRNATHLLPVVRAAQEALILDRLARVRQDILTTNRLRGEFQRSSGYEWGKATLSRQRARAVLESRLPPPTS